MYKKKACDTYPWGHASILNKLLYYIYKEEQGEIQYAPTRGDEDFLYYILHLIIYYLITNDQEGIKKLMY